MSGCDDDRAERVAELADDLYGEALNNENAFQSMNDNYEILDAYHGQIMRVLRNLDDAIKEYNYTHAKAFVHSPADTKFSTIGIDAVFTALGLIQINMQAVCTDIADGKVQSQAEIDADEAEHHKEMMEDR